MHWYSPALNIVYYALVLTLILYDFLSPPPQKTIYGTHHGVIKIIIINLFMVLTME